MCFAPPELPEGWEQRLIELRTENQSGVAGWCLHPLDIAISKLAAGRPKDLDCVRVLKSCAGLSFAELQQLAATLPEPKRDLVRARLGRLQP